MDNDSDSGDTMASSDCSDSSEDNNIDNDSETESYRSLAFSLKSNCSTAVIKKSNKSKKRVRFKPGDSLVLIYEIPNRAMLGLKSDSEDSDDSDNGDDSDDEEDDDDDDDDDDDADDDDDDEDEDCEDNGNEIKSNNRFPKPFGKLISVKQINRRKQNDRRLIKGYQETTSKLIRLSLSAPPQRQNKRQRNTVRTREKKERIKSTKKESHTASSLPEDIKTKPGKSKRNTFKSIKSDIDKVGRLKRKRNSVLEIKATVDASSSVPKLIYKNDLKPSIINVNGSLSVSGSKQLIHRTRLQPTSFRLAAKRNSGLTRSCSATSVPSRQSNVHQVVSTSYDSFPCNVEETYVRLQSLQKGVTKEVVKRADPDNMNDEGKRHYAWQIANGTITSQSLRTPSILPFWDSLRSTMAENNAIN